MIGFVTGTGTGKDSGNANSSYDTSWRSDNGIQYNVCTNNYFDSMVVVGFAGTGSSFNLSFVRKSGTSMKRLRFAAFSGTSYRSSGSIEASTFCYRFFEVAR